MKDKEIAYTCIRLNDSCDKMFEIMKEVYPEMEIHDLTDDIKLKTPEEITKKFKKFIKITIIKSIYTY